MIRATIGRLILIVAIAMLASLAIPFGDVGETDLVSARRETPSKNHRTRSYANKPNDFSVASDTNNGLRMPRHCRILAC
jgi:hypothetical protein